MSMLKKLKASKLSRLWVRLWQKGGLQIKRTAWRGYQTSSFEKGALCD
jgi:hypothetical protein